MTIAAGFQVMDGFVFCSDTEATSGSLKLWTRKVLSPSAGKCRWIYTGAGDSDFLRMAARKIENRVKERRVDSVAGFEEVVEEVIVSVHEKNIAAYPDDEKPSFSLIIGLLVDDHSELIRTNATSVETGAPWECVGSGSTIGKFILDKLSNPLSDVTHATITAMYMLQQARKYAPHCGGHSHVFSLLRNGKGYGGSDDFAVVSPDEIEEWEAFFNSAESLVQSFLISYTRERPSGELLKQIRKVLRTSKKLPQPYSAYERLTSQSRQLVSETSESKR